MPGQVAGDALLCRIPCVGGDGAVERIAFPKTCGEGRTISEIGSIALDLLKNHDLCAPQLSPNLRSAHLRAALISSGTLGAGYILRAIPMSDGFLAVVRTP